MLAIIFLSDDYVWTDKSECIIFYYLCNKVFNSKIKVMLNNDKFKDKIEKIIEKLKSVNDVIFEMIGKSKKIDSYFLDLANILIVDQKLKIEIGEKIPYIFQGEVYFIE